MNPLIADDGFQFGLGAFETIAVEQGHPILLSAHLNRLKRALEFLQIYYDEGILRDEISLYIRNHSSKHTALKLIVTPKNIVITARPNPYTTAKYAKGFTAQFSEIRRNETSMLTFYKTLNYGDCILEKRHAVQSGLDEFIFCNMKGQITEGTTTNIFFARQQLIVTPPVQCGLLNGIMRSYIMQNWDVQEKIIYPSDILDYDECFVSNSLMGVMPLRRLGTSLFPKANTYVSTTIQEQYQRDMLQLDEL